jgi:hypothetical protein
MIAVDVDVVVVQCPYQNGHIWYIDLRRSRMARGVLMETALCNSTFQSEHLHIGEYMMQVKSVLDDDTSIRRCVVYVVIL